eukprot:jgi/Chlat1/4543/Chrsp29S04594
MRLTAYILRFGAMTCIRRGSCWYGARVLFALLLTPTLHKGSVYRVAWDSPFSRVLPERLDGRLIWRLISWQGSNSPVSKSIC